MFAIMNHLDLTPAVLSAFLCPLAIGAIMFVIFYFGVKATERNGMMEAFVQRGRAEAAAIRAQQVAVSLRPQDE
jgi:hypothetical protein